MLHLFLPLTKSRLYLKNIRETSELFTRQSARKPNKTKINKCNVIQAMIIEFMRHPANKQKQMYTSVNQTCWSNEVSVSVNYIPYCLLCLFNLSLGDILHPCQHFPRKSSHIYAVFRSRLRKTCMKCKK